MAAKSILRILPAAALGIGVVVSASPANAIPECVNTAPNTTVCSTNGSAQISTYPGPWTYNHGWPWFGWPGFVIGFG